MSAEPERPATAPPDEPDGARAASPAEPPAPPAVAPPAPSAAEPAPPPTAPVAGDDLSRFEVRAYSPLARAAAVLLHAVAALNVTYVAAHVALDVIEDTQTAPPMVVALGLAALSGGPWLLATLVGRALRAQLEIGPTHLALARRAARYEIPLGAVKAVRPFALPLPGPGLALELSSGRLFEYRLVLGRPGALLAALAGRLEPARAALARPAVAHADAKYELGRRRWPFWAFKWGLVPLALAVIAFRLNQYIMYGGPFGQYQLYGLGPYVKSFVTHWAAVAGWLALYAAVVRALAELAALAATRLAPARARLARRAAEALCDVAFFGAVPALVAARLLL